MTLYDGSVPKIFTEPSLKLVTCFIIKCNKYTRAKHYFLCSSDKRKNINFENTHCNNNYDKDVIEIIK